jgi:Xaa-Pro aminopeptidase
MRRIPFTLSTLLVFLALIGFSASTLQALEKQPTAVYHGRRVALGDKLKGGVAILFAAEESELDFSSYRQDPDFYYLTGWNQPGAALLVIGPAAERQTPMGKLPGHEYREILFLPTRNLRAERYSGEKMDAATPNATTLAGVDEVKPLSELPGLLNKLAAEDPTIFRGLATEPESKQSETLLEWTAVTFGQHKAPQTKDLSKLIAELRLIKDAGEVELLKKAESTSILGQRAMFKAVHPGATELAVAGAMTKVWMENGCQRPAYFPIVGSGPNSTTLHYSENSRTMQDGEVVVVDAACEYSMYASDITRTVPVNGHFTDRQREIYNVVYGAQKAAIDAFVAGKSKLLDWSHTDPDALDTAAYNYINTHGKGPHGEPLGKYWMHGLGHMVGIDVHDVYSQIEYPAVLKPGMVFTIEPGVYIPEENIGVRLECVFLVGEDGKLIDLTADLPHTAEEIEAAMKAK